MATSVRSGSDELGRLIRERRQALGLSRRDLADLADLSYPYVSQLETGYRMPSSTAALVLSKILGLSLDQIFGTSPELDIASRPRSSKSPAPAEPPSMESVVNDVVQRLNQIPPEGRLEALSAVQRQLVQQLVDEQRDAQGPG